MDPDRLEYGRYVVWDPQEDVPTADLERGHPGVVVSPHWQDVGVLWLFREAELVSEHVYDYRWLREVATEEFVTAAYAVLQRRAQHGQPDQGEK